MLTYAGVSGRRPEGHDEHEQHDKPYCRGRLHQLLVLVYAPLKATSVCALKLAAQALAQAMKLKLLVYAPLKATSVCALMLLV